MVATLFNALCLNFCSACNHLNQLNWHANLTQNYAREDLRKVT